MSNQALKQDLKLLMLTVIIPYFILLVLKQVNVLAIDINDPYAKICVPDIIRNLNVKVFNLMSTTIETRHTEWHETCKCQCRLDAVVCNNKQH